eukprot:5057560-Pleurochrysis_carterae.AAC.1
MTGIEPAAWRRRRRIKEKAGRVAVMIARMLCIMTMPSDDCALEMALRTVGSMQMSMSSQSRSMQRVPSKKAGKGGIKAG